jgi:hypothetical protein
MAQNLTIYAKYVTAGSSSNQIYQDCIMAGSSSQDATETAYPTNTNPTNTGYTYLSSATKQRQVGLYVQYPFPSGSATSSANLFSNGVLVSSSKQAEEVRYATSADLHTRGQVNYWITSSFIISKENVVFTSASLKDYIYVVPTSHSLSTIDYTDQSLVGDILYYYSASVIVTKSLQSLTATTSFSESVALGRIAKISVPFEYVVSIAKPTKSSVAKITLLNYNGIVQSLNTFNTISSSISNGVTSSFAVLFVSASKANMGSVVGNNLYASLGTTQNRS